MKGMRFLMGAAAVLLVLCVGCQAVFTFSPMSFLQRDPSRLPLAQKMTYAENALASGDDQAMLAAYNAIKNDAGGSSDGDLNLLAARLAMELSGVPDLINEALAGNIQLSTSGSPGDYSAFLAALDVSYLAEADGFYLDAQANGGELNSTDYLLGTICILAASAGDPPDFTAPVTAPALTDATAFLDAGINSLPPGDPAASALQDFYDFIDTEMSEA